MAAFDVRAVQQRLAAAKGGYEVIHESAGLEVGVYVLAAPEPDRQQPHAEDEIYLVLEGSGVLEVAGEPTPLGEGEGMFVRAGLEHHFSGYERLSLLVIFVHEGLTSGLSFDSTPGPGDSEGQPPASP
ncbi:MAG TPA: cupin domain-containing protein [Gaiellaceae bacterium]